jgi:hypothetical protein
VLLSTNTLRSQDSSIEMSSESSELSIEPADKTRTYLSRLSMESCLVSLVRERGRTPVRCISKPSSLLNRPPNSKFILSTISLGRHLGNEQAVILVWLPVTTNGCPSHVVKSLSRRAHTGQQRLQTPICGRHFCTKSYQDLPAGQGNRWLTIKTLSLLFLLRQPQAAAAAAASAWSWPLKPVMQLDFSFLKKE